MRDIKFRGKRLDNGEWVYGYYVANTFTNPAKYYIYYWPNQNFIWEVEPDTVGQYTGLIDKNGTPIYEGDIIKVNYTVKYADRDKQDEEQEHTATTIVFWNDFRASFALEFHKYANDDLYRFVRDKYAEVIGNIHENPELLEGE